MIDKFAESAPLPNLYDAHNHLQDERLAQVRDAAMQALRRQNLRKMVVNGAAEADWPVVLELARTYPEVVPSFGCHPWYIRERSPEWEKTLTTFLERVPSALGEIGLDKWIKDYDLAEQERVFLFQLGLAAERNLPVSIHCLQAWGRLLELLERHSRPRCGFLLHSFGGPREMIASFAELGAYFSLPGYFFQPRKSRRREVFLAVPRDRLLIETDAPDQLLPPESVNYPLMDARTLKPLNHPANLSAIYRLASDLLGEPIERLAIQIERNFTRLFGGLETQPRPESNAG